MMTGNWYAQRTRNNDRLEKGSTLDTCPGRSSQECTSERGNKPSTVEYTVDGGGVSAIPSTASGKRLPFPSMPKPALVDESEPDNAKLRCGHPGSLGRS